MKERIRKVMEYAQLSQQDFAAKIDISASSLSGIFTGRTNPTAKTVSAIHTAYPEVNIGWLMFGDGEMLNGDVGGPQVSAEGGLFASVPDGNADIVDFGDAPLLSESSKPGVASPAPDPVLRENMRPVKDYRTASETERGASRNIAINIDKKARKIKEIRVFFDDGTFEAFVPASK